MSTVFEYNLRDKVLIPDLNVNGIIVGLYANEGGPKYEVTYFLNGDRRVSFFLPEEVTEDNRKPAGFI